MDISVYYIKILSTSQLKKLVLVFFLEVSALVI
jgi:hypothetical protein